MKFDSRSEWGAVPPTGVSRGISPSRGGVAIHWNGPAMGLEGTGHSRCLESWRGIQRFHMAAKPKGRGWNDIAYTAGVCPHGYVLEGRGPGVRTAANGTNEGNSKFYAVMYLGGEGEALTLEAQQGIRDAVEWLRRSNDKPAGSSIVPHRSFQAGHTQCPGDEITRWIRSGGAEPLRQAPPPTPQEDDMPELYRAENSKAVYEVVGSARVLVTGAAFAARRLTHGQVQVVPANDPVLALPVVRQ